MEWVINIASVVVVLGLMILVHEWGHFIAARACGVRVDVFSIGFGPRLWGWRRGPTDYRVSALPLGGYVRMAGDNPAEERSGAPDEFLSKPRWQRAVIVLAGPAMNLISAVVLVTALNMAGTPVPVYLDQPAVIGQVPPGSPAERLGLQPGDRMLKIGRAENPTWEQAYFELAASAGRDLPAVIARDEERIALTLPASQVTDERELLTMLGEPQERVVVGVVAPGMPAERAGLQAGDEILAVNGQPMANTMEFRQRLQQSAGQPVELLVRRGEQRRTLSLQPEQAGSEGPWQIGIQFEFRLRAYPFGEAFPRALGWNVRLTQEIIGVVGRLVTGSVSIKQLEGPLGIMRHAGAAAQRGPIDFLSLMAIISLNLGILNLLPIPILDGGHILMLSIESAMRRDLSVRVKERFVQVGLVFLLVIFAIVMYNDVLKIFTRS